MLKGLSLEKAEMLIDKLQGAKKKKGLQNLTGMGKGEKGVPWKNRIAKKHALEKLPGKANLRGRILTGMEGVGVGL